MSRRDFGGRAGFSLLELVVSIGIITLLVGILVPLLGHFRERARSIASIAQVRTHVAAVTAYTGDYNGSLPYYLEPGYNNTISLGEAGDFESVWFFDLHRTWHLVLAQDYYNTNFADPIFQSQRPDENDFPVAPFRTPYYLPCVFQASPAHWTATGRLAGTSQYGATRLSSVRYTSVKSLIVEGWPFARDVVVATDQLAQRLPTGFADGSAKDVGAEERLPGYRQADGNSQIEFGPVHYTDFPPLLHTLDGIYGRDVR